MKQAADAEQAAASLGGKKKPPAVEPDESGALPLHTTKPAHAGMSADRFAAPPVIQSSDGSVVPLVPAMDSPAAEPSDATPSEPGSTQPAAATLPPPGPLPGVITPEEAKLFGRALRQYFEVGCSLMLGKRPELAVGLIQITGSPQDFQKNFAIAGVLVESCGERTALKYNLRIPYMDEAVVIGAIGIATFGIAIKPSKAAQEAMKKQQDAQRAGVARNANPAQPSTAPAAQPTDAAATSAVSPQGQAPDVTPIDTSAAGAMVLD